MNVFFDDVKFSGIATAVPENKLDLHSLSVQFGENEIKRIVASTGISTVRVANHGVNSSDLCLLAAKNLIKNLDIDVNSIDAIVFVSQTHDAIMPSTSVMLQHRLGISTHAVAFDISYGCSGYVYGIYQAAMLIAAGGCSRVLLCAGDVITPLLNPLDRHVRMVFGDAGSATLIESGKDKLALSLRTDGSGMHHLMADKSNYLHMNGYEIMEFALREVPLIVNKLLDLKEWQADEVGTFALHQANKFMLDYLRKKMMLSKEAVPIAVEDTGNTGPASIPLLLSLTHKRLRDEDRLRKVVMCGFGVGLSWAAAGMDLSDTIILPPVEF